MQRSAGWRTRCCAMACLLLVAWSSSVWAKCPTETYVVQGRLLVLKQGPLDGARVLVFLDDFQEGASTVAAADGSFAVETLFNSYKGMSLFLTDRCGKRPSTISIMVEHPSIMPRRATFKARTLAPAHSPAQRPTPESAATPHILETPPFDLWPRQ